MKRPVPKERVTQRAILRMAGMLFPDVFIHHSAVVKLTGGKEARARQMGAMKCDGFKPGFPDLLCLWRGGGLLIEVKREKGGVISDAQKGVHERLQALDWPVSIVRTVDEATNALRAAGAPCLERVA